MADTVQVVTELKQHVMSVIERNRDELVGLVGELVRIPSLPGEEAEVATFLHKRVRQMGFEAELLEMRDRDLPAPGRPGVAAYVRGTGGGYTLMFNGHLDTEPVSPAYADSGEDPFSGRVEDGKVFGIGTMNMKAAVTCYFFAMKAVVEAGFRLRGDVIIAAVPAELNGGAGTRYFMETGLRPDMVINGEASELGIITSSAGIVNVRLVLHGQPTHMAFPDKGRSVVEDLQFLLAALPDLQINYDRTRFQGKLEPKVNVGHVNGGYEYRAGLFMDSCQLVLNVRGPKGVEPGTLRHDFAVFLDMLRQRRPGLDISCSILNPIPRFMPPFHVSQNEYIVRAVHEAHQQVTGRAPSYAMTYAGVDAGTIQHWYGVPGVVYGPAGATGSFTPPETVEIAQLMTATKTYALAALDVCSHQRGELDGKIGVPT
jgi:acetylornithine deacetylase/succinyl-diaminopimelate desuccinylase-like protein